MKLTKSFWLTRHVLQLALLIHLPSLVGAIPRRFPEPLWHWKLRRKRHRARRWLRRSPGDTSLQACIYRAALSRHHGSKPPKIPMTAIHLSHDGKKYQTIKQRDDADKAFNKAGDKRSGKGNSHRTRTSEYSKVEWDAWRVGGWKTADDKSKLSAPTDDDTSAEAYTITEHNADGRFSCKNSRPGQFGGVQCQGCITDWHYRDMHHRLCNGCLRQFPESVPSVRLKKQPIRDEKVDPNSPAGIVAVGKACPEVCAAAAQVVGTSGMVADLPAAGAQNDPANAKGGGKKVEKKKDDVHIQKRQAIADNLAHHEKMVETFRADGPVPQTLLDKVTEGKKSLAKHDKKYNRDNSIRTIAEVAEKFHQLELAVNGLQERILKETINLAHEVATRELLLEKLVQECNAKKAERKIARARGRESTITHEVLDMAQVVAKIKDLQVPNLLDGCLLENKESV